MKCRTFTHHVGTTKTDEAIRVECAAHPRWFVDAQKTGDRSARQVAIAAAAQHEAEDPSAYGRELDAATEGSSAEEHDPRCRLPLPHDRAACLEWARGRVAANRADALARRAAP